MSWIQVARLSEERGARSEKRGWNHGWNQGRNQCSLWDLDELGVVDNPNFQAEDVVENDDEYAEGEVQGKWWWQWKWMRVPLEQ